MQTKLHINVQQKIIEVDGDAAFVSTVYDDFKDYLLREFEAAKEPAGAVKRATKEQLTNRAARIKSGTSCAERILAIKTDGFFNSLRSASEVGEKLAERGTTYASNQVTAALTNLTKRSELRRVKQDGSWKYQNP